MSTPWRPQRRANDLRPTWEERHAALESVRERLRRQGALERRLALVRRLAPLAGLLAFALGTWAAPSLLRAGAAAQPELFALRRLAIAGAAQLDAAEVARAAGLAAAESLAPEELVARLARHPWIAGARAARVSPDTMVVRVVERVPAAIWLGAEGARLVDAAGIAFAPAEPGAGALATDLPRLRLAALDAGSCAAAAAAPCPADPQLAAGVELARAVERAGFAQPELELDGPDPRSLPVLRLAGVAPRVLLGGDDLGTQLERLTRVLADVPVSREVAEIDLRFAGQVVLRPPPPETEEADEASPGGGPAASRTGGRAG
ncbi:MAG: FtsQ-type POTRA domain-containing protein [Sorangiineae bacterium]|nr:FtsQ-type POTRA domain-containing protein [Sorangiineae bacterium]